MTNTERELERQRAADEYPLEGETWKEFIERTDVPSEWDADVWVYFTVILLAIGVTVSLALGMIQVPFLIK